MGKLSSDEESRAINICKDNIATLMFDSSIYFVKRYLTQWTVGVLGSDVTCTVSRGQTVEDGQRG